MAAEENIPTPRPPRLQVQRAFLTDRPHWSRARIYRENKRHPGLIVRWDGTSLVNVDKADEIELELVSKGVSA